MIRGASRCGKDGVQVKKVLEMGIIGDRGD